MKVENIYRLVYKSNDKSLESNFYPTKEEALSHLEAMKDWVQELYEWDDGIPLGGTIKLQVVNIEEIEDIEDYADNIMDLSEWVNDEETTAEYRKDMLKEGITTDESFGKWEDEKIKGETECI